MRRRYTAAENVAAKKQLARLKKKGADKWSKSKLQNVAIFSGHGARGHALWRAAHTMIRARKRNNAAKYKVRKLRSALKGY